MDHSILNYALQASMVWFLGFFPLAEIYIAVPAGYFAGLDPLSTVIWATFGNWLPIPLILYGYDRLARWRWLEPWLQRCARPSVKQRLDSHGFWFIIVITPWIGIWIMAATARLLGMNARKLAVATAISVTSYAIAIAAALWWVL